MGAARGNSSVIGVEVAEWGGVRAALLGSRWAAARATPASQALCPVVLTARSAPWEGAGTLRGIVGSASGRTSFLGHCVAPGARFLGLVLPLLGRALRVLEVAMPCSVRSRTAVAWLW